MSPAVVSEDRVRVIVNAELAQYEQNFGQKRHEQNIGKFDEINATLSEQRGSFRTVKLIGGFIAFLVMATFALLMWLGTHKPNGLANIPVLRERIPEDIPANAAN